MGRVSRREKVAEWRGRLERFEGAGVTVATFCQDEGVSAQSFYQWRKKLRAMPERVSESGSFRQLQVETPLGVTDGERTTIQLGEDIRIELGGDLPVVELIVKQLLAMTMQCQSVEAELC